MMPGEQVAAPSCGHDVYTLRGALVLVSTKRQDLADVELEAVVRVEPLLDVSHGSRSIPQAVLRHGPRPPALRRQGLAV